MRLIGWTLMQVREQSSQTRLHSSDEVLRMLHIGESSTFGLGVDPTEAYSARVRVLLEQRWPSRQIESTNRGRPGLISLAMLKNLPAQLDELQPDIVTIMAGANDFNVKLNPFLTTEGSWLPRDIRDRLWRLRIYKLIRLLFPAQFGARHLIPDNYDWTRHFNVADEFRDIRGGPAPDKVLVAETTHQLETNLHDIIALCRSANATVLLVGYIQAPSINKMLRKVADDTSTTFVEVLNPGQSMENDMFIEDGWHPSALGHAYVAERIIATLIGEEVAPLPIDVQL